ncbi:hypothetical protein SCUP234_02749 [Seiridium cupressi]
MAFLNPIQIIATLFLALVALPLAFLAGITTWLACWILALRLLWVYAELGLEILRYVLWDRWWPGQYIESPSVSRRSSRPASPSASPPRSPISSASPKGGLRSRRRTGSSSSAGSMGPRVAFSGATLLEPSNALERDFEGLGGWRIAGQGDAADEHAWGSLNSRLEIPGQHRHHSRAQTHAGAFSNGYPLGSSIRTGSKSGSHSPDRLLLTMGQGPRGSESSRTPTRVKVGPFTNLERIDSYFPLAASAQPRKIPA